MEFFRLQAVNTTQNKTYDLNCISGACKAKNQYSFRYSIFHFWILIYLTDYLKFIYFLPYQTVTCIKTMSVKNINN